MCGLSFDFSRIGERIQNKSIGLVSHRGPDNTKVIEFENGICNISFCRLAIRELIEGNQPLVLDGFISCFNGELYNQEEIEDRIRELDAKIFIPRGDMNVLALYLFLTEGRGITNVVGMFAGFIYFAKTSMIKLFRDRTGEKPIFYSITDERISVLSENRFRDYQNDKCEPIELTYSELFQGFLGTNVNDKTKSCPTGSIVSISLKSGNSVVEKYWHWPQREFSSKSISLSDFEVLLENVVESQLVSDVPVAVLLSSGIDSSVIASIAKRKLVSGLSAFTLGFEDNGWDESNGAKRVADYLDIDHRVVRYSYEELADLVPSVLKSMDVPIFDPATISMYALCKAVSKSHRVAIGGDGGDELFRGYDLIANEKILEWLRKFPIARSIPNNLTHLLMELPTGSYNSRRMKLMRGLSVLQNTDITLPLIALSPFAGTRLTDKIKDRISARQSIDLDISAERYYQEKILPSVYLIKSDRMSMAHSLELRSPLLDHRLIEVSMQLASKTIQGFGRKGLLSEIAKNRFPNEILQRRKHGFSPPFSQIIQYLPEQDWEPQLLNIFGSDLQVTWEKAKFNQNHAFAAWALLVCNYFIANRNLKLI